MFEIIKNKLSILLYGLDGDEDISKELYDNPDYHIDLCPDDINYILSDSFEDFITNVEHKLNEMYGSGEEDGEEDGESDGFLSPTQVEDGPVKPSPSPSPSPTRGAFQYFQYEESGSQPASQAGLG